MTASKGGSAPASQTNTPSRRKRLRGPPLEDTVINTLEEVPAKRIRTATAKAVQNRAETGSPHGSPLVKPTAFSRRLSKTNSNSMSKALTPHAETQPVLSRNPAGGKKKAVTTRGRVTVLRKASKQPVKKKAAEGAQEMKSQATGGTDSQTLGPVTPPEHPLAPEDSDPELECRIEPLLECLPPQILTPKSITPHKHSNEGEESEESDGEEPMEMQKVVWGIHSRLRKESKEWAAQEEEELRNMVEDPDRSGDAPDDDIPEIEIGGLSSRPSKDIFSRVSFEDLVNELPVRNSLLLYLQC
jgi:hypothetical protein